MRIRITGKQEMEYGGAPNVVVEKKEQILGDFNNDGTPALMGVNTGSHASGNDQAINVPDGAFVFSDTAKLKVKDPNVLKVFGETKKKTPAEIAKKYDLQKFSAIVSDPKSDNMTRKTAEMMQQNYLGKLTQLAQYQEGMKEAMGITPPQQGQQVPMQRYGGLPHFADGGYDDVPVKWYDPNAPTPPIGTGQDFTVTAKRPVRDGYLHSLNQMPTPIPEYSAPPVEVPPYTPISDNNQPDITTTAPPQSRAFTNPDRLAMASSLLNLASIHKYLPYEAPISAVLPDTVFTDPRRALAANAEQANSAYTGMSNSGNNKATMSNYLATQGQAGTRAADIIGQYSNQNVGIANQANQNAAGVTNQVLEQQRARLKSLHQGNTIAAQQYDNSLKEGRADLLNTYEKAFMDRLSINELNATNQIYKRDPRTGELQFRDEAGRLAMQKMLNGSAGSGQQKSLRDWKQAYIDSGGDPERAAEFADDAYREQSGLRQKTQTTSKSGSNKTVTTNYGSVKKYGGPFSALDKFLKK